MKRILVFLSIIITFLACNKKEQGTLIFNTKPAVKFIDLMNYLEKKSPTGFDVKNYSQKEKKEAYQKNLEDSLLKNKINSLLDLPTYSVLSEITTAFIDTSKVHGKEAYRIAFLNLPYRTISMTGGISESWLEFWKNKQNKKALKFIDDITRKSKTITRNTQDLAGKFLPTDLFDQRKIETIFCIDGNRGSFTTDAKIYMDLLDFNNFDIDQFTKVLAHEYHHVIYEKWLDQYNEIKSKTEKEKVIFNFQKGIIMEGLAQQINYKEYSEQIMKLYNNKVLLKELQNTWMNTFKKIVNSKNPSSTFESESDKMWENGMPLLKKYCNGKIEEETYAHRPSTLYYLGFHLYHTILKNGGEKKLKLAINHPELVLEIFNQSRNDNSVLPEFPQEIVKLWEENFKK